MSSFIIIFKFLIVFFREADKKLTKKLYLFPKFLLSMAAADLHTHLMGYSRGPCPNVLPSRGAGSHSHPPVENNLQYSPPGNVASGTW